LADHVLLSQGGLYSKGLSALKEQELDHLQWERRHTVPPNLIYAYNQLHGVHILEDFNMSRIVVTEPKEAALNIPHRERQVFSVFLQHSISFIYKIKRKK
jgi:hypothetical protein